MSEKYEDVPAVDKMRSITEFVNRAGFVAMSDAMRKKLWKLSVRQCAVLVTIAKSFLETSARIESAQMERMEELCADLTDEERQIHDRVLSKLYAAVIERDGL